MLNYAEIAKMLDCAETMLDLAIRSLEQTADDTATHQDAMQEMIVDLTVIRESLAALPSPR